MYCICSSFVVHFLLEDVKMGHRQDVQEQDRIMDGGFISTHVSPEWEGGYEAGREVGFSEGYDAGWQAAMAFIREQEQEQSQF